MKIWEKEMEIDTDCSVDCLNYTNNSDEYSD